MPQPERRGVFTPNPQAGWFSPNLLSWRASYFATFMAPPGKGKVLSEALCPKYYFP